MHSHLPARPHSLGVGILFLSLLALLAASTPPPTAAGISAPVAPPSGAYGPAQAGEPLARISTRAGWEAAVDETWLNFPLLGGEMTSIAADPFNPATIYVGTRDAGVFKTLDSGLTWLPARTGLTFFPIRSLFADPVHPGTLYAGTDNDGVWKTTDGGTSWAETGPGLDKDLIVLDLVIDPNDPNRLFAGQAGGLGLVVGSIYRSSDGGATWQKKDTGLPRYNDQTDLTNGIYSLAIDPTHPDWIYAGTSYDGAFRSLDGGENWTDINTGIPFVSGSTEFRETVQALALDPFNNNRPAAIITGEYYVFESDAWHLVQTDGGYANSTVTKDFLYFHPTDENVIYSAGSDFKLSVDGGLSWQKKLGWNTSSNIPAVAFNPSTPDTIFAASNILFDFEGGVWKTLDRGETWTPASQGITAVQVQSVAAHPQDPLTFFAGASSSGFFYRTTDGGANWERGSYQTVGDQHYYSFGAISDIAIDPLNPQKIYLAGNYFYVSTNGGQDFEKIDAVDSPISIGIPLQSSNPVYAGTLFGDGVLKSIDDGLTWEPKNTGLPIFGSRICPILTLSVDPQDANIVFAGTQYGGGIVKTTDGGENWVSKGLTETNFVDAIAIHPQNSNTLLVGAGFLDGSIYKSTDGGESWRETATGIALVQEIVYDPRDPDWVYAITEGYGVLRSSNGGENWYSYNEGLFYPVMYSAAFTAGSSPRLVAGSYGSGLYWITPDISQPLTMPLFLPLVLK